MKRLSLLLIVGGFALLGADGDITFADFLTPQGSIIAAGIVTGLIEMLKNVFPGLDARVSGAAMAFYGTAILYAITAVALQLRDPQALLGVFLAWLGCATSAIGIKSTVAHAQLVRAGSGNDVIPEDDRNP